MHVGSARGYRDTVRPLCQSSRRSRSSSVRPPRLPSRQKKTPDRSGVSGMGRAGVGDRREPSFTAISCLSGPVHKEQKLERPEFTRGFAIRYSADFGRPHRDSPVFPVEPHPPEAPVAQRTNTLDGSRSLVEVSVTSKTEYRLPAPPTAGRKVGRTRLSPPSLREAPVRVQAPVPIDLADQFPVAAIIPKRVEDGEQSETPHVHSAPPHPLEGPERFGPLSEHSVDHRLVEGSVRLFLQTLQLLPRGSGIP